MVLLLLLMQLRADRSGGTCSSDLYFLQPSATQRSVHMFCCIICFADIVSSYQDSFCIGMMKYYMFSKTFNTSHTIAMGKIASWDKYFDIQCTCLLSMRKLLAATCVNCSHQQILVITVD